jgi:hypothetical protein
MFVLFGERIPRPQREDNPVEHASDARYDSPDAWEIAVEVSEATVAMDTSRGVRPLGTFPDFRGSLYLRPNGELAGFAVFLEVSRSGGWPRRRGTGASRSRWLFWEAVDLTHSSAQNFSGNGRLRLDGREIRADVHGQIARIPCRPLSPYLKIVIVVEYRALSLGWPRPAARRFRKVQLRLFTEIRPRTSR